MDELVDESVPVNKSFINFEKLDYKPIFFLIFKYTSILFHAVILKLHSQFSLFVISFLLKLHNIYVKNAANAFVFLSNNYSLLKNIKYEKIFTIRLRDITFRRYLAMILVVKFFYNNSNWYAFDTIDRQKSIGCSNKSS